MQETEPSKLAQMIDGLPPSQIEKIKKLAEFRGDSFDRTLAHVADFVGLRDVPSSYKPYYLPKDWGFKSLEVEGAYHATITLKNDRILTGYRSDWRFQRYFRCLSDLLPPGVAAESYEVYVETYRRYDRVVAAKSELLPPRRAGGTMVDAGAYIGFKGVGYADYMGPKGRTVLIDIDPISDSLARRNIEQNGLQDRMQSFCCAIWSENRDLPPGTPPRTFDRVRNTLVAIDEHPTWTVNQQVATRTLDSIFREANLDEIDYLNMQLNGAEYDALDGLVEYFDKTRVIYCAASFHAGGKPLNERLAEKLAARGCWVRKGPDSVIAVTPRYRSNFKATRAG